MRLRLITLLLIPLICFGDMPLQKKPSSHCIYDQYSGAARVLSIQKTDQSKNQKKHAGFEGYEILFTLDITSEKLSKKIKTQIKQPYLFLLDNGWYPGDAYLKKYSITIGQKYPGVLKVRQSGNCPRQIFFDEPTLKGDDYFEGYLTQPVIKPVIKRKPVLYLYPKQKQNVIVKLSHSDKLIYSYPAYPKDGWKITAYPDGTLIHGEKSQKYYTLFWEWSDQIKFTSSNGPIIKQKDTANFLDSKLKGLGLNWRERNEFIIYWLPYLAQNKTNQIRFYTKKYEKAYPISIIPRPDTLIRIYMVYSKTPKFTKDQKIRKPVSIKRTGFTTVEWGGSEIK